MGWLRSAARIVSSFDYGSRSGPCASELLLGSTAGNQSQPKNQQQEGSSWATFKHSQSEDCHCISPAVLGYLLSRFSLEIHLPLLLASAHPFLLATTPPGPSLCSCTDYLLNQARVHCQGKGTTQYNPWFSQYSGFSDRATNIIHDLTFTRPLLETNKDYQPPININHSKSLGKTITVSTTTLWLSRRPVWTITDNLNTSQVHTLSQSPQSILCSMLKWTSPFTGISSPSFIGSCIY